MNGGTLLLVIKLVGNSATVLLYSFSMSFVRGFDSPRHSESEASLKMQVALDLEDSFEGAYLAHYLCPPSTCVLLIGQERESMGDLGHGDSLTLKQL